MENSVKSKFGVYEIAVAGIFGAISLVLAFTPAGFIPLPNGTGAATTLLIPVIVAGIIAGPLVGAVVGLILGGSSWMLYSGLFVSGANGNVAIGLVAAFLPRLLAGPAAWLAYRLLARIPLKASSMIGSVGAAVIGTSVNTFGVLGTLILFGNMQSAVLMGALAANYPVEIVFSVIANVAIVEAIRARSPEKISAAR